MIGPFVIHVLTFIVFKSFLKPSSVQVGFAIYVACLIIGTYAFKLVAKARMGTLSVAQTFSILSYSQIYFIPFGIVSRIRSGVLFRIAMLLPPLLVQPISAYNLSILMLPGESEMFYGLCHVAYGFALVAWAIKGF